MSVRVGDAVMVQTAWGSEYPAVVIGLCSGGRYMVRHERGTIGLEVLGTQLRLVRSAADDYSARYARLCRVFGCRKGGVR